MATLKPLLIGLAFVVFVCGTLIISTKGVDLLKEIDFHSLVAALNP